MKQDIILAGVGGQGILSIAYVIDNAALADGLFFKQAEVHGMAQRGGAVQSHLRLSDGAIWSDLIPKGAAAQEPREERPDHQRRGRPPRPIGHRGGPRVRPGTAEEKEL